MNNKPEQTSLLLRNARIVLPERVAEVGSVLIEEGRIVRIDTSSGNESPHGSAERDLRGLTLFPGFVDVHIHGAVGIDTMEARAADLEEVSQFLATQGVTGWMPTLVPAPNADYARAIEAISEAMRSKVGARILGVHYEGPFVNAGHCGALRTDYFKSFSLASDVETLPTIANNDAALMMTLAPEIEGGIELVKELVRRRWIVSIGHTKAGIDVLNQALEAGARHMTHFMNAMPLLHHRDPGPVGWGLTEDSVSCDLIADGIHLDRRVLQLVIRSKTPDRLLLISDAIAAAGKGDGDYQIWGEQIRVRNGRTSNPKGSIAGSVITMLDAARMMQSLGVTEVDVARMSATNAARLLRIDHDCGSIEEGKRADLVALDDSGNLHLTIVGGQVLCRRASTS